MRSPTLPAWANNPPELGYHILGLRESSAYPKFRIQVGEYGSLPPGQSRRDEKAATTTGAAHHAMNALECVARDVCGDERATLGQILDRYSDLIPRPLDTAVEKAWAYASEMARHIREGREPEREEVELVVGLAATVATYLSRKNRIQQWKTAPERGGVVAQVIESTAHIVLYVTPGKR